MHNAVTKILITIIIGFFIFNNKALAQESGGGIGGTYICNNGCNPSNPLDGDTIAYIRSVVNQDVSIWRVGDTVNIYNPQGQGGEWGRLRAGPSQFEQKRELTDGNPQAGNGSGGDGNGSGGGSSGGGNGGGGAPWGGPWGPGGGGGSGGDGCPGGVTFENNTIICHQS